MTEKKYAWTEKWTENCDVLTVNEKLGYAKFELWSIDYDLRSIICDLWSLKDILGTRYYEPWNVKYELRSKYYDQRTVK